jgi:hypothetical protein
VEALELSGQPLEDQVRPDREVNNHDIARGTRKVMPEQAALDRDEHGQQRDQNAGMYRQAPDQPSPVRDPGVR